MDQQRIRKIRKSFPSITGFLEELCKNSSKTHLGSYSTIKFNYGS